MSSPCVVILAAGQGRRFQAAGGQAPNKLLAICRGLDGQQRPVLEHTLLTARAVSEDCLLITRPENFPAIDLGERYGCQVLLLASAGMGDSLARAVEAASTASGWLIVLGDMPFLRPQTLAAVAAAMGPGHICVPVGAKGQGHPVGFGKTFGAALRKLTGDQGARRLFHQADVVELLTDDPGIYLDVDIPQDLHSAT